MEDDRLHAVLIEPQLERFRAVCGVGDAPLTASFEGWHRHAILSPDRVFLFPRDRSRIPGLIHEAELLRALDGRDIPAPRLLGHWRNPSISPYPFLAVSRLPGQTWSRLETAASLEQLATVLEGLGEAIATWHRLELPSLPRGLPARRRGRFADFERCLDLDRLGGAATLASRLLDLPGARATAWTGELEPALKLSPVLVHGDINEGQILVDDDFRVTGILDWETAGVGHPLKDFDFGEWGYGIFAHEERFDHLRRRMWEAYARARGGELPPWRSIELFFCLTVVAQYGGAKSLNAWGRKRLATNLELLRRLD